MNDHDIQIQQKARQWMISRDWRIVYGKKGAFTQSLLQHTDIQLNVLLELLPVLTRPEHYGLSDLEQQALIIGQIAHDVGKESKEWQQYVTAPRESQHGRYIPHILRPLTDEAVADLAVALGFSKSVIPDATKFVNLHMAAARGPTNVLAASLLNRGDTNRWNALARIVDTIDNICSVRDLLPTLQVIEADQQKGGPIGPHIKVAYHSVNVRGVSSVLLHAAAEKAYCARNWSPILYFSNGTIYAVDGLSAVSEPSEDEIMALMAEEIEIALPTTGFRKMVVGSPLETLLPKPEFFDYREIEGYLREAATRIRLGSFKKKRAAIREKVVRDYTKQLGQTESPSNERVEIESERIDTAQPEMVVFKFFKYAISPDLVDKNDAFSKTDEAAQLRQALASGVLPDKEHKRVVTAIKKIKTDFQSKWLDQVAAKYELCFGQGSFARLQSTSTLMPAKDMVALIDPFWGLSGESIGIKADRVELAHDKVRMDILVSTLVSIASEAYELLPEQARPTRATSHQIAEAFVNDLIHPSCIAADVLAAEQLEAYIVSKPKALRPGDASRLCPICNKPFAKGTTAKADFLDNPESHTNRAVSHGATGYIVICDACKYERFLQQLLLGDKVARMLVIMPRNHIGRQTGQALVQKVETFQEDAMNMMSNDTLNPNRNMTLALTNVVAAKLLAEDERGEVLLHVAREGLDGSALAEVLSYQMNEHTQKEHRNKLSKALLEEYGLSEGASIEEINDVLGTDYVSWDALLDDVISGNLRNEIVDDIRRETYRLYPQLKAIYQTPNMILVPLKNNFAVGKESDTNAGLRELFVSLLIGLSLDCSVAAISSGDVITLSGGEGVARVPPVPAIRDLIGDDWVGLNQAHAWLERIGAASLLAGATAYPERSNLYQILRAMTPGHVLRRVEMQSGYAGLHQLELIRKATQAI